MWHSFFWNKQWKWLFNITVLFICTKFDIFLWSSVKGKTSNLWAVRLNLALVSLGVFLAGQILYFEFLQTVIMIKFCYSFCQCKYRKGSLTTFKFILVKETWSLKFFYCCRKDLILFPGDVRTTSSYMYTEQTTCVYNNANELFVMSSWIR